MSARSLDSTPWGNNEKLSWAACENSDPLEVYSCLVFGRMHGCSVRNTFLHFEMPPFSDIQDDDDFEVKVFAMDKDQHPGQAMWDLVLEAAAAQGVLLHKPVRSGNGCRPPKPMRELAQHAARVIFEARFGADAERRHAAHAFVEELANQPTCVATYAVSVFKSKIRDKGEYAQVQETRFQ